MSLDDRDYYLREKHRKMRERGTWGEGEHGSSTQGKPDLIGRARRPDWPYGHLSDGAVAEHLKLEGKAERHAHAPGDHLYQLPIKTPLWLKVLLTPFLIAGTLIATVIVIWFVDILFDTGIINW
jgi:hypothetical protein